MKLFSKRHSERRLGVDAIRYRRLVGENELISPEARNRLVAQIRFLSSSNDYLEWFILFEDKRATPSVIRFDEDKLDDFSLAELGYKLTDNFNFYNFEMLKSTQALKYASDEEAPRKYFDDYHLFDLAEITILFAIQKQRKEVIKRIGSILKEENTPFEIVEHLITRKSGDDLKSMMGILKDDSLKLKLERFFEYFSKRDYINAAKMSADIINIIFSDVKESGKKTQIETIKSKLSEKLILDSSEDKKLRIASHINDALLLSRALNNDIYDIRHTEKSTLTPANDNLYKLVAQQNLGVIELTLTALKDDFVLSDDWENVKAEYTEQYKIDTSLRRTRSIKPPEPIISLDDIPF